MNNNYKYIVNLYIAKMRLFYAEDEDCPDRRTISSNERAIRYWLNKITEDKELQDKIEDIIDDGMFGDDITFKTIVNELKEIGVEIEQ